MMTCWQPPEEATFKSPLLAIAESLINICAHAQYSMESTVPTSSAEWCSESSNRMGSFLCFGGAIRRALPDMTCSALRSCLRINRAPLYRLRYESAGRTQVSLAHPSPIIMMSLFLAQAACTAAAKLTKYPHFGQGKSHSSFSGAWLLGFPPEPCPFTPLFVE